MTSSIDILDIISENALACKLEDTTNALFHTSEAWEENLQDDSSKGRIFLLRPILEKGKVLPQGNPFSTYPLIMFFYEQSSIDAMQADLEPIYKRMRTLKRQFIVRLQQDSRVNKIVSYTATEESYKTDRCNAGITLMITIEVDDNNSVCLT